MINEIHPKSRWDYQNRRFPPPQMTLSPTRTELLLHRPMADLKELPPEERQRVMLMASSNGRADIIRNLLECDPALRDCADAADGSTALHVAVGAGSIDAVRALLRAGAKASAVSDAGQSAYELCTSGGGGKWEEARGGAGWARAQAGADGSAAKYCAWPQRVWWTVGGAPLEELCALERPPVGSEVCARSAL